MWYGPYPTPRTIWIKPVTYAMYKQGPSSYRIVSVWVFRAKDFDNKGRLFAVSKVKILYSQACSALTGFAWYQNNIVTNEW